jgi:transposase
MLYMALELGGTTWTLGFTTSPAQRPRLRQVAARDRDAVRKEILKAKVHFELALETPVRSCYEAGRDGFWVHRWLCGEGVDNVVVDSSSIEVNRRARRAKTDRLDVGKLLHLLLRYWGGERQVWSVVHVPSLPEEAQRHVPREVATVREDRKRVRNRIQALLATQGLHVPLRAGFPVQVAAARTGDGQPVPAALCARLTREWEYLEAIERRLATITAERDAAIATGTGRVATVARQLCRLRGVAETSAAVFSAELFGTRTFSNGRQLGALVGLVPVPYRSDQLVQDQGISKAGRAELRRIAIQVAWGWVRWQPDSALTQWFQHRFAAAGGRSKRVGIVAMARKLLIALWRYVDQGVEIAGAILKPCDEPLT